MKKNLLIAFLVGGIMVGIANAQQAWDSIVAIAGGSYATTYATSVLHTASTLYVPINYKRVDVTCRNNSAYTIYIGTEAASTSLNVIGFPIYSYESWEHRAFNNSSYALSTTGAADVRCWDGSIR